MAPNINLTNAALLLTFLFVLLPVETYAFGAGDIPDFAYLNDKAFRHGDIENILETLVKSAGGAVIGGTSLLGFASSMIKHVAGGSKFSKSDIKKVYFGNWLRDYSQAMDVAGLSKLSADTLVLIVSVLGFMTFGYSTEEFQVTADRLGVYLPVEHIDNPKGYAEKEGDARQFHAKLRPPVQKRELEIDQNTGMKNYMATENQGWDTSTAFIRRTFRACIEAGRRAQGKEGADLWEAYRLLGTGLHTMEDLLAHSNWCEVALRKLGYKEVFCHVGDQVIINTPTGPAPPLVTGTFGSADFLHSLLGEAGDKLSQASVTDLSQKMESASQGGGNNGNLDGLRKVLSKISGGGADDKLNKGEEIKQHAQGYHFDPNNIAPPEVRKLLLDVLKWHDEVMRDITRKIEMVPGLTHLVEECSNALNKYVYTVLAPYLGPILTEATSVLNEGSKAVIDSDDQYEVFNNPNAHDPSHSLLSKDHFGLILNEPAGKIAQIVVEYSVNLIVPAWSNGTNPDDTINQILKAFHHPYYTTGHSEIQRKMFDAIQKWIDSKGQEAQQIIQSLTKESVREHRNKRQGLEDTVEPGYHGCGGPSVGKQPTQSGGVASGYASSKLTQSYGQGRPSNRGDNNASYGTQGQDENSKYGGPKRDDSTSYGFQHRDENTGYGGQRHDNKTGSNVQRDDNARYGNQRVDDNVKYSAQKTSQCCNDDSGYGGRTHGNTGYGGQRRDDTTSYGGQNRGDNMGYGYQRRDENAAYGGQLRDDDIGFGGQRRGHNTGYEDQRHRDDTEYGGQKVGYGGQRRGDNSGYGGQQDDSAWFGGRRDDNTGYGDQKRDDNVSYGAQRRDDTAGYGRRHSDTLKHGVPGSGHSFDYDSKLQEDLPGYGGGQGYETKHREDHDHDNHGPRRRKDHSSYDHVLNVADTSHDSSGGYGGRQESGYTQSYGQSNATHHGGQKIYGGYDDDEDEHGMKNYGRDDGNDTDTKKAKAQQYDSGGRDDHIGEFNYSARGGGGYGDGDDNSYGRRKDRDDDFDNIHKHGKHRGGQSTYGSSGQSGYGPPASTGYAPSYGGQNDAFGAENLDIRGRRRPDNDLGDDDDRRHSRSKHGGSGGY